MSTLDLGSYAKAQPLKRGGLGLTILVVVGGFLRFVSVSPSAVPLPQSQSTPQKIIETRKRVENRGRFRDQLALRIKESFPVGDLSTAQQQELLAHLNVPQPVRYHVRFLVAILPDPTHTHLSMFFDRSIEALQLAAQRKNYVYDRAILPWDQSSHAETPDFRLRAQETQDQDEREAYPGLMIFRAAHDWQHRLSNSSSANHNRVANLRQNSADDETPDGPLFVFVVGETPTGGIRREQLRNALKLIQTMRGKGASNHVPLLVLGPTFSGSLASLGQELEHQAVARQRENIFVYSGTVTNLDAQCSFRRTWTSVHFASFQENDTYALQEFLAFAQDLHYKMREVAVLSEDETIYGGSPEESPSELVDNKAHELGHNAETAASVPKKGILAEACPGPTLRPQEGGTEGVVQLHFPREISYLRTALQKIAEAQRQPPTNVREQSRLPLDLNESGHDDDSVPPYAPLQTPLSQEAEMIGIVSELQKHHIRFTLVLATDPLDQLFLARYLRQAYPQGRVVITVPDLLLNRQDDSLLHGVMALNSYSLIPGFGDRLLRPAKHSRKPQYDCRFGISHRGQADIDVHDDHVFVSSNSIGTFNAMVGLLSVEPNTSQNDLLPGAPYFQYGPPKADLEPMTDSTSIGVRPILWLTMLGRDGYWPIVGLSENATSAIDWNEPILAIPPPPTSPSTLQQALAEVPQEPPKEMHVTPAWTIAYFVTLVFLTSHVILSAFGSILADSEARAQFSRNVDDVRGAIILAVGAFALSTIFVLIMCIRTPTVAWAGSGKLTVLLWLPYLLFIGITIWDLGSWRQRPGVAICFAFGASAMTAVHIYLVWSQRPSFRMFWSTRVLHLASGLSPILPMLLLMIAGYWWMWASLKGIALVDLRRPRLPKQEDLPTGTYRISDSEADQLRNVSHPLYFTWQGVTGTIVLAVGVLAVADRTHPVQTIEGVAYDWGYALLLALMVVTLLGCLLKLVLTWFKCRQILVGLDRLPLRHSFSRMKRLSWKSLWTPGGSSLRETYKIMSRAIENLVRLQNMIDDWSVPIRLNARMAARAQVCITLRCRKKIYESYERCIESQDFSRMHNKDQKSERKSGTFVPVHTPELIEALCRRWKQKWLNHQVQANELQSLVKLVESLQKEMARTTAVLIKQVLPEWWSEDTGTVVSEDERFKQEYLPPYRALAEEFAAITYVNFLSSVLLRIRNLVICAGVLYALIVMSVSVYPFEPHSTIQTTMVTLLFVMALVIGYVYAEMHREAILSRLTSTKVGELGWDFWLKFASAAVIPVVSLVAGQFPEVNRFLFSWLEPALQAVK
jgi:hypothetical protein